MLDSYPKLVAIDEEADHQIVHRRRCGKAPIRRLLSRGKTPPLRNFWLLFFRCVPPDLLHSQRVAADASLFSCVWCRPCGRRTKHPSGSRLLTSCFHARRLPLAPSVPQKTVSSLPCPIVYCSQMPWLPYGSRFPMAHGRGVARLHNPVAGHL